MLPCIAYSFLIFYLVIVLHQLVFRNENNWFNIFQEVSEPAAVALVNLSQRSDVAAKMVDMGMTNMAMDLLFKSEPNISRLLVMLLVNLTQLEGGTASLLQVCTYYDISPRNMHKRR